MFRHGTSRNLDPQLHAHTVITNMVRGGDAKWRTKVDDGLFHGKMAIGVIYQAERARSPGDLGYDIEKTGVDGRFEIAGMPRAVFGTFSTCRAENEAANLERGTGESKGNPHREEKVVLLTCAARREIGRDELERGWKRQAKRGIDHGKHWSTDEALAREFETIALRRVGQRAEKTVMRAGWRRSSSPRAASTRGQKEAVKTILARADRVVSAQDYAGTGKTTKRLRALAERVRHPIGDTATLPRAP